MGRVTDSDATEKTPGFGERGRMRRRARFLRKARELAYRDLGGLVFDLHRFGQRNDPIVMAKLSMLRQIDTELRALESALQERRGVTVLREIGVAACPRCAAIHGGEDRFCPGCGLAFDTKAERPISTSPVTPGPATVSSPQQASSRSPTEQPVTTPQSTPAPGLATALVQSSPQRPAIEPASTAAPVPARPAEPAPEEKRASEASEDEPTRILRPGGSDA